MMMEFKLLLLIVTVVSRLKLTNGVRLEGGLESKLLPFSDDWQEKYLDGLDSTGSPSSMDMNPLVSVNWWNLKTTPRPTSYPVHRTTRPFPYSIWNTPRPTSYPVPRTARPFPYSGDWKTARPTSSKDSSAALPVSRCRFGSSDGETCDALYAQLEAATSYDDKWGILTQRLGRKRLTKLTASFAHDKNGNTTYGLFNGRLWRSDDGADFKLWGDFKGDGSLAVTASSKIFLYDKGTGQVYEISETNGSREKTLTKLGTRIETFVAVGGSLYASYPDGKIVEISTSSGSTYVDGDKFNSNKKRLFEHKESLYYHEPDSESIGKYGGSSEFNVAVKMRGEKHFVSIRDRLYLIVEGTPHATLYVLESKTWKKIGHFPGEKIQGMAPKYASFLSVNERGLILETVTDAKVFTGLPHVHTHDVVPQPGKGELHNGAVNAMKPGVLEDGPETIHELEGILNGGWFNPLKLDFAIVSPDLGRPIHHGSHLSPFFGNATAPASNDDNAMIIIGAQEMQENFVRFGDNAAGIDPNEVSTEAIYLEGAYHHLMRSRYPLDSDPSREWDPEKDYTWIAHPRWYDFGPPYNQSFSWKNNILESIRKHGYKPCLHVEGTPHNVPIPTGTEVFNGWQAKKNWKEDATYDDDDVTVEDLLKLDIWAHVIAGNDELFYPINQLEGKPQYSHPLWFQGFPEATDKTGAYNYYSHGTVMVMASKGRNGEQKRANIYNSFKAGTFFATSFMQSDANLTYPDPVQDCQCQRKADPIVVRSFIQTRSGINVETNKNLDWIIYTYKYGQVNIALIVNNTKSLTWSNPHQDISFFRVKAIDAGPIQKAYHPSSKRMEPIPRSKLWLQPQIVNITIA